MNYRLLSKQLGYVSLLIGLTMVFSLPWAYPALGQRYALEQNVGMGFESDGFYALLSSIAISLLLGGGLWWLGRTSHGVLYRKEAMAIVGLSWVVATLLGSLPFYLSGTSRSASVRWMDDGPPQVFDFYRYDGRQWLEKNNLTTRQRRILERLLAAGARGISGEQLREVTSDQNVEDALVELAEGDRDWDAVLVFPGEDLDAPPDRGEHYRIRWIPMGIADSLFESQSGFSTTGATVISDLEDPYLIPHCILFWRSSTHFLGGLGIIVLFVVILGQGSAGKALMRAEMPGPTKEGATARMQHTAWLFSAIYCALNAVLAIILWLLGMSPFDALCHAMGTMATGGFSTYNASLGHFDSALIDYVVILFMVLAGSNFILLYLVLLGQPMTLLRDVEWRTYLAVISGISLLVVIFGMLYGDFSSLSEAIRFGLFQVVSIITTTGYGTHDFDNWNSFGRGVLFLLMFVGGCAGSTGGGMKVIRHILFLKILRLEIEQAYHPSVVRPLRLGGKPLDDPDLRKNILIYFGLILVIFVFCWMFLVTVEPDLTWGSQSKHKLIDSASGIAATLNNIGPGLGTVGATQNYGHFSPVAKILFVWLMMIGRLEIFSILVLFVPNFWRSR